MSNPLLLDGTATAKVIRDEVAARVRVLKEQHGVTPGLAAVLAAFVGTLRPAADNVAQISIGSRVVQAPLDAMTERMRGAKVAAVIANNSDIN